MPYTPHIWTNGPQGVWPIDAKWLNNLETGVQQALAAGGGSSGPVAWADITGKPATFPPSAHGHDWSEITGKPATFAPSTHTHDFTTGITGKPTYYPSNWSDLTGKPATFAPSAHSHDVAEIIAGGTRDNTTFLRGDATWAVPPTGGAGGNEVFGYTSANQTTTQPAADIPNFQITVATGDIWIIEIEGDVAAASGTATGINFQLASPNGATTATPRSLHGVGTVNAATAVLAQALDNAIATTAGFNKSTTRGFVRVRWFVSVSVGGTLRVQMASSSATIGMTLFAGAVMRAKKLN
jgi:hypothetical protein